MRLRLLVIKTFKKLLKNTQELTNVIGPIFGIPQLL